VAKRTDEADEFRVRPNRPFAGGKSEARAWSTALRTVLRYAGTSRRSKAPASSGGPKKQFNQRCAVRTMYTANKTAGQWRAHRRYIARESAGGSVLSQVAVVAGGDVDQPVEPGKELERWQSEGDPRLWKLIVSPEFGERVDLDRLTRDLMMRMEKDLGTKLEWVAATHLNTEHPHVHIALRGVREDKSALDLPRDYVRHGIRAIAEDLCTRQLGHRNQLDAVAAERREVQERRFTSLDRWIKRSSASEGPDAEHFAVQRRPATGTRDQHIDARLLVLQQMALAKDSGRGEWLVRRDFETVLKAMQRTNDRQKMLASNGALLSDGRLPLVVLDLRRLKSVEGRVLAHGEDEAAGRHYLLLEGTDAKVHLIYYTPEMEEARSRGKLRVSAFVRLQKQFEGGRPALQITDHGDAEKVLKDRLYLREKANACLAQGAVPAADGWGGWLGRYQAAVRRTAAELMKAAAEKAPSRDR
jgi:type IV secretory pathway VirD2 relaxase